MDSLRRQLVCQAPKGGGSRAGAREAGGRQKLKQFMTKTTDKSKACAATDAQQQQAPVVRWRAIKPSSARALTLRVCSRKELFVGVSVSCP